MTLRKLARQIDQAGRPVKCVGPWSMPAVGGPNRTTLGRGEAGVDPSVDLTGEILRCRLCSGRFAATVSRHAPRPVPWLSSQAPILVAGQAPGARVHASGMPFDDPSGDRLRDWLGVDRPRFYDRRLIAILPMAFCFPGLDGRGADMPPPPACARTWRARSLAVMPQVRLTLLVGGHAQRWHLGQTRPVTEVVRAWRDLGPEVLPLPHPSWRNSGWLNRNPWFETEVVPELRARVSRLVGEG